MRRYLRQRDTLRTPDMSQHSLLVVEDDPRALAGYLEFLSGAGFTTTGAADGAVALTMALEHPPSAIITDIDLPIVDGIALAHALHQDPRTRDVPIIGLTGHWAPDVHSRATSASMRAVLMKPCLPVHLLAELERVLTGVAEPPTHI